MGTMSGVRPVGYVETVPKHSPVICTSVSIITTQRPATNNSQTYVSSGILG